MTSESGGSLKRKTLGAFDASSGSRAVRCSGVFSPGTSNSSRQPPCRAGSRFVRPPIRFLPSSNRWLLRRRCRRGIRGCAESPVWEGKVPVGLRFVRVVRALLTGHMAEKSDRPAAACGNSVRIRTGPWNGLETKFRRVVYCMIEWGVSRSPSDVDLLLEMIN